jgi:hypothetical protein
MDELGIVDLDEVNDEEARVARAASELGVEIPRDFKYLGIGPDGKHHAACHGDAADFRATVAILRRLEGKPIAECPAQPEDDEGPRPEWWPPDDLHDTEAWLAYLEERERHPEWPQAYNGGGEWAIALISAVLGTGGIAGVAWAGVAAYGEYQRRRLAEYTVDQRRRLAEFAIEAAARTGAVIDAEAVITEVERSS